MKATKSVLLLSILVSVIVFSCQKDEFNQGTSALEETMLPAVEKSGSSVLYYPSETFTIVSKDPLVQSRALTNKNYKYFENFILKVQNGINGRTKVPKIEILLDGVTIITSSDFKKNANIVSKPLTGLNQGSTLVIKLEGSKGRFIKLLIECSLQSDVISDIDGNYYHTVKIGDKWWMAENLRVTKDHDGTPLKLKLNNDDSWSDYGQPEGCYCYYNNDISFKEEYGALYNVWAVNSYNKICPVGWHVAHYYDLMDALHVYDPDGDLHEYGIFVGGELKEAGYAHWQYPNAGATNNSGFNALPGGYRLGSFVEMGHTGKWWLGWGERWSLTYNNTQVLHEWDTYEGGYSIRCVKDY